MPSSSESKTTRGGLVVFTGAPPASAREELVQRAAEGRQSAARQWLQEQIADALYRAALRRGGWVLDIGVWGPAAFQQEAAGILAALDGRFAYIVEGEEDSGRLPSVADDGGL